MIRRAVLKRFAVFEQKQRLPHAYLFVGPDAIGKSQTALGVAKLINCEEKKDLPSGEFCDSCPSCQKINTNNHPDVRLIDSSFGESIKIEQIRGLLDQIRLRPFMSEKKIFIIPNVDRVTLEAGNALLKTLEEPTDNSLLILTTSVPEKVLDTIKSRCYAMLFSPLPVKDLKKHLEENESQKENHAHFLAHFSDGCLGKAQQLHTEGIIKTKDHIIKNFITTDRDPDFAKEVLGDKEKTKEFLQVLLSWNRDCLLLKSGAQEKQLIHKDRLTDLKNFQKRFSFEELQEFNNDVVDMCQLLAENLNLKIPLMIIKERLRYG